MSPITSAVTRVSEVALGGIVAIAVSMLVFPERAHRLGLEAAARILRQMADVVPKLMSGFRREVSMPRKSRVSKATWAVR